MIGRVIIPYVNAQRAFFEEEKPVVHGGNCRAVKVNKNDLDTAYLNPIDLSSAVVREKSAKWLVELAEYMMDNPHIIVNRFVKSGILAVLDKRDNPDDLIGDSSIIITYCQALS